MKTTWISDTRKWLCENTPCTKIEAIEEITKFMPLCIRGGGGKVLSRVQVAIEAIRRVYKMKFEDLPDVLVRPANRIRKDQTGVSRRIRELSAREEGVTRHEVKQLKNGLSIANQLVKKQKLKLVNQTYFLNTKGHA